MTTTEIQIAQPTWGIAFPRPAVDAGGLPLRVMPLPDRLVVALQQNPGIAAKALVKVGALVARGEPIGITAENAFAGHIHAPSSGKVVAVESQPVPGLPAALCVHIEVDHEDRLWEKLQPRIDLASASTTDLRTAIASAGIVGLGGALFPASIKLDPDRQVNSLILNGVECEPRINCDDALIQHRPDEVLLGAQIMMQILGAQECLVALKADAKPALDAMRTALEKLGDKRMRLALLPPVYPAGGEAQLIQLLSDVEIPAGGLPWETGHVCQNVATAAAVARFISTGEPPSTRIVTLTGSGLRTPVNVETRIGTSISDLVEFAGGYASQAVQLSMGGPMMGLAVANDSLPVTKACNCIYIQAEESLVTQPTELPCIRCGDCAVVCPVMLSPQLLLSAQRISDFDRLSELGLDACVECGCCDYVCPSHIPLTAGFTEAKQQQRDIAFERRRAEKAELRFAARSARQHTRESAAQQALDAQTAAIDSDPVKNKNVLQELLARVNKQDKKKE